MGGPTGQWLAWVVTAPRWRRGYHIWRAIQTSSSFDRTRGRKPFRGTTCDLFV
jgi:hypothetical protein